MGRGKLEISRIQKTSGRQIAFSKRCSDLSRKAHELSVLCDAEVAILAFSNTGELYSFASRSSNLRRILERYYRKSISSKKNDLQDLQMDGYSVAEQMSPQNIQNLDSGRLCKLEEELLGQLCAVRKTKDQKMMKKIEELHLKDCYLSDENQSLNDMVVEVESMSSLSSVKDSPFHIGGVCPLQDNVAELSTSNHV